MGSTDTGNGPAARHGVDGSGGVRVGEAGVRPKFSRIPFSCCCFHPLRVSAVRVLQRELSAEDRKEVYVVGNVDVPYNPYLKPI